MVCCVLKWVHYVTPTIGHIHRDFNTSGGCIVSEIIYVRDGKTVEDTVKSVYRKPYHVDSKLSLQGRGLLITLLSLPKKWNPSVKGLVSVLPDGQNRVMTAKKELETLGYLTIKRRGDGSTEWIVTEFPGVGNPDVEKPHVENPHVDFQAQEDIENKRIERKEEEEEEGEASTPQNPPFDDPSPVLLQKILSKAIKINPAFCVPPDQLAHIQALDADPDILADSVASWLRSRKDKGDLKYYIEDHVYQGAVMLSQQKREKAEAVVDPQVEAREKKRDDQEKQWKFTKAVDAAEENGTVPVCPECRVRMDPVFGDLFGKIVDIWSCACCKRTTPRKMTHEEHDKALYGDHHVA